MRKFLIECLSIALLLAGCASKIGRPTITQITTEPPLFLLAYPLSFSAGDKKEQFDVPSGFVTDLASIPRVLWWWQAPHERTMAAAIVHDFLYWEQPCTKAEADAVMYLAMKQTGMKASSIELVYAGIRTPIGQAAWDKNRLARDRGEARFFSQPFSYQLAAGYLDKSTTLATIQADARLRGEVVIPDLPLTRIKAVCRAAYQELESIRSL